VTSIPTDYEGGNVTITETLDGPKSGGQIIGTISRRNDDEIRLTLRGPLPGEFILKLDKK
jgi:hypothetical protein